MSEQINSAPTKTSHDDQSPSSASCPIPDSKNTQPDCGTNAASPNNKRQERWPMWNAIATTAATIIIALATIATVGVTIHHAEIFNQQLTAMRGQLAEMKNQRLMTVAQLRANIRREQPNVRAIGEGGKLIVAGEKITGWIISPAWTNAGGTDAKDYRGWFDIKAFDVRPGQTNVQATDCLPIPEPNPLPPAGTFQYGATFLQAAQTLAIEDAVKAQVGTKYIFMRGHIQYRDIFPDTLLHYADWCVAIIPNDLERSLFSFLSLRENTD
ncbi:MAG: hypothetical protein HY244_09195 [Rhizobiales bacterium]|nr:hypothetical protein [Hyphomicrobiales bacterium]